MVNSRLIKNYLGVSIWEMLKSPIILYIFLVPLCICLDTWNQVPFLLKGRGTMDVYYYLFNSITYGGVFSPYLVPILSVLPYGCSYFVEKSANIRDYIIGRTGKGLYVFNKWLLGILGGAVVPWAGVMLFSGILSILVDVCDESSVVEGFGFPYYQALVEGSGMKYVLIVAGLQAMQGIIFTMFTQIVSLYVDNVYSIVVTPLLIKFVVVQTGRVFRIPDEWRIDFWFSARSTIRSDSMTLFACLILTVGISVLSAICCNAKIHKED